MSQQQTRVHKEHTPCYLVGDNGKRITRHKLMHQKRVAGFTPIPRTSTRVVPASKAARREFRRNYIKVWDHEQECFVWKKRGISPREKVASRGMGLIYALVSLAICKPEQSL